MSEVLTDLSTKPMPMSLQCKLASIIIHADEFLSDTGTAFDRQALESVLGDIEVQAWLKKMSACGLLPVKR